jgi:hypothetical protein
MVSFNSKKKLTFCFQVLFCFVCFVLVLVVLVLVGANWLRILLH